MKVAIYAGHQGKDPGAISPADGHNDRLYTVESTITACISDRVADILLHMGVDHFRAIGSFQSRLEQTADCTVGVSIHCDSATSTRARGHHIIHYPRSKMGGIELAHSIDESLMVYFERQRAPHPDRRGLRILKTPFPCVVVECGFLSNPTEESWLHDTHHQFNIAFGIVDGLRRWRAAKKI